jgi:hypothetical protein
MHGGRREGAGRPVGSKNRFAGMIKHRLANLARRHGPRIIEELFKIATTSPNHTARVLACRELLDCAYGKPEQAVVQEVGDGAMSK